MSPAERLRSAATRLREVASVGLPDCRERWAIWPDLTEGGYVHVGNAGGVIPDGALSVEGEHTPVAKVYTPELAHYIAMMSPPVALALADWLDDLADHDPSPLMPTEAGAFKVADAVLGGEQS